MNLKIQKHLNGYKKNADEYGFILRYPKDKQDITKLYMNLGIGDMQARNMQK